MFYVVMMSIMIAICLLAVILKLKDWYIEYTFSLEKFYAYHLKWHDINANNFNDMSTLDELVAQFMQKDELYFINFEAPIETCKRLRKELDASLMAAEKSNQKARQWEEEARMMHENYKHIKEENDLLREGTKMSYTPTNHLLFKSDNIGLINYDDYTFLVYDTEQKGIIGAVFMEQKNSVSAVAYRKTIISPPDYKIWEKNSKDIIGQYRIDEIKDYQTLRKHLPNFHLYQTEGLELEYPSAYDFLNGRIEVMQERGKAYERQIQKIQRMEVQHAK